MRPPFTIVSDMELSNPMSKAHRHRSWQAFKASGTRHSPLAQTLPAIIRQAEQEGVPYQLTAYPGAGYHIRPLPPIGEGPRFEVRHDDQIWDNEDQCYCGTGSTPEETHAIVRALLAAGPDADALINWRANG